METRKMKNRKIKLIISAPGYQGMPREETSYGRSGSLQNLVNLIFIWKEPSIDDVGGFIIPETVEKHNETKEEKFKSAKEK